MNGRRVLLLLCFAMLGVAFASWAADAPKADAPKTPWKITGQLEEACTCDKACPCWFDSKPTRMTCGGGQFLFIQKGTYGSVTLDGLALGFMGQSPPGKGMMESFGQWDFTTLYIDQKASPEQRKALEAIGNSVMPMAASPKQETRYASIARTIDGKEHKIDLGQYGKFSGHLIEGGLGGSVKITNPPGADPLHKEYEQGQSTGLTYNDSGQNWNVENTNYMYATFQVDNVMYEKYAAGLAQKMQQMKK